MTERVALRRREWAVFLAVAVAFALLARQAARIELRPPPLPDPATLASAEARTAPDFELPTADGSDRLGLAELAGRVVLLNFWATWCRPCEAELPSLETLHRTLGTEGLSVVSVAVDAAPPESVARFAQAHGVSFPVLHDANREVAGRYGVRAWPTSFVIAPDSRIVYALPSAWDWAAPEAIAWLRELMAPAAPRATQ